MDSKNMSLDDIIALNKKSRSGRDVGGFRSEKEGRGGKPRVGAGGSRGFHSSKAPAGKWAHDKFEDNNSGGRRGDFASRREGGAPRIGSGNPNKTIRVLLSNLAPTVVTADLEELFEPYDYDTCVVHYNEAGESLGSGDLHLKRKDALKMITDLNGMAIDGMTVKMSIVDTAGSIADRVQFTRAPLRSTGGVEKRRNREDRGGARRGGRRDEHDDRVSSPVNERGNRGTGGRGGGRGGRRGAVKKDKLSAEELDAQLDSYMKSAHKDDVAME